MTFALLVAALALVSGASARAPKATVRTWSKAACGQLAPLVRAVSGVRVQVNVQNQAGGGALDCRYTAGGVDGAFLLDSKRVSTTWLTRSLAQQTAADAKRTCGDTASPAAVPLQVAHVGDAAFGLDACPGDTLTNEAMGQTAVYAQKGTTGWWVVAQPPFAATTVAKLTALLKKLLAAYP